MTKERNAGKAIIILCIGTFFFLIYPVLVEGVNQGEWEARALTLGDAGNWYELIVFCQERIKEYPENFSAWLLLGTAFHQIQHYDEAIDAFRRAVLINPENAGTWLILGKSYYMAENYDQAIVAFRQSLVIDPKNVETLETLAHAYILSNDRTAALGVFRELNRLDPERANKLFDLIMPR